MAFLRCVFFCGVSKDKPPKKIFDTPHKRMTEHLNGLIRVILDRVFLYKIFRIACT